MQSERSKSRARRLLTAALIVLALVAAAGAVRTVLVRGAHRLLRRWEQGVLSGSPVEGSGPWITLRWPPQAEWRDLRWNPARGGAFTCDRLRVEMLSSSLLRGRLAVGEIELDTLRVTGRPDLEAWASKLVRAAEARPDLPGTDRPDPHAVRLSIHSFALGSSSAGPLKVEGWSWSPGVGRWNLLAAARLGGGESIALNGQGIESPSRREGGLGFEFASGRTIRIEWSHSGEDAAASRIQVEDDGALLEAILDPIPLAGSVSPRGRISLDLSRESGGSPEGEVRIAGLRVPLESGGTLRLEGLICIEDGRASLEPIRILSAKTDLLVTGDIPLAAGLPPGSLRIKGPCEGYDLAAEGRVIVAADSAEWMPAGIRLGSASAGRGSLVWRPASAWLPSSSGRLRGELSLGSGRILLEGSKSFPGAVHVYGRGLPFEQVVPWLPFDLAGDWSGIMDVEGDAGRAGGVWSAKGTAAMRGGRVSGLEILDEIGSLAGGAGRGIFRLQEARMRWFYRSGDLLADSLAVETGKMRIEGTVFYADPDSLLGLLHVTPEAGSGLSSILRLLGGGREALDLGVRGDPRRPNLIPLDGPGREAWGQEIDELRARFRAPA